MDEKLSALRDLFPEAFREDKLDTDLLSATLWDRISTEKEAYGMTWAGKADARRQILTPTSHTLTGDEKASVQWNATQNILIEWDNLTVLKLLQKGYTKQVKMVYIDPPYNTGADFVYNDTFHADKAEYEEATGQRTAEGVKMVANTETNGRYHSDWLSMMYPRLHLARNLLRDDGVIFVSIDDHEVHNLRKIMDEIFGEENFVACFPWRKRTAKSDVPFGISQDYEWTICYAKDNFNAGIGHTRKYHQTPDFPNDRWRLSDLTKQTTAEERPNSAFDLIDPKTGKTYPFNQKRSWSITKDTFQEYYNKWKIVFPDDYSFLKITIPAYRVFESEDKAKALEKHGSEDVLKAVSTFLPKEVWMSEDGNEDIVELFWSKIFSFPKPVNLVKHFLNAINTTDALILDFFAGSGTTGHAVMSLNSEEKAEAVKNGTNPDEVGNRQYICVQLPELTDEKSEAFKAGYKKISDITAERLRRADKKIVEENKDLTLDTGFRLYRLTDSCYKVANVNYDSDNEQATLESFEKALKDGLSPLRDWVTEDDIITENLIKEGFPLNIALSKEKVGKTAFIHAETEGKRLFISFDDSIPLETIDEVQKGYKEAIFVVYDTALTDPLKVMLASRVTLRTI
jgi:adenine-specific DNA-methyltransferase